MMKKSWNMLTNSKLDVRTVKKLRLEDISNQALIAFRKSQAELVNTEREGYHVSDYVGSCMRKTVFSKSTEQSRDMSLSGMTKIWTGQVVHKETNLHGLANELMMCYDIVEDKPIAIKDGKAQIPSGRDFIDFVIGSCDDILDSEYGNVIVDKKTMDFKGYVPKKPYDHHVLQLELYRLLLNKCKKMDAEYGCNLYIDMGERGEKIYTFSYPLTSIEKTLTKLKENREQLLQWKKTKKLPKRVVGWECNYCSHVLACFSEKD